MAPHHPERDARNVDGDQYDPTGAASKGWNEPDHGYRPSPGYEYTADAGYDRRGLQAEPPADDHIRAEVRHRLDEDPRIDARDISVFAKDGTVTLSGPVRGQREKRQSEDVASHVPGVRGVHNNLRVIRRSLTPYMTHGRKPYRRGAQPRVRAARIAMFLLGMGAIGLLLAAAATRR
jgi:hypothetical protein